MSEEPGKKQYNITKQIIVFLTGRPSKPFDIFHDFIPDYWEARCIDDIASQKLITGRTLEELARNLVKIDDNILNAEFVSSNPKMSLMGNTREFKLYDVVNREDLISLTNNVIYYYNLGGNPLG